jgi:hypothetical protein
VDFAAEKCARTHNHLTATDDLATLCKPRESEGLSGTNPLPIAHRVGGLRRCRARRRLAQDPPQLLGGLGDSSASRGPLACIFCTMCETLEPSVPSSFRQWAHVDNFALRRGDHTWTAGPLTVLRTRKLMPALSAEGERGIRLDGHTFSRKKTPRRTYQTAADSVQSVYLANKRALADAAKRRITAHFT